MSNINRHQAGTVIAGQKTGGQFAPTTRGPATFTDSTSATERFPGEPMKQVAVLAMWTEEEGGGFEWVPEDSADQLGPAQESLSQSYENTQLSIVQVPKRFTDDEITDFIDTELHDAIERAGEDPLVTLVDSADDLPGKSLKHTMPDEENREALLHGYTSSLLASWNGPAYNPKALTKDDISPDTKKLIEEDLAKFIASNRDLYEEFVMMHDNPVRDSILFGIYFWETRNFGHGSGFANGRLDELGESELGDKLTKACEEFGGVDLTLGDDGKLHALSGNSSIRA